LFDKNINNSENHGMNRGVELILTGGKRKKTYPFHIIFEKMVCFLNKEITIYFEFSFKLRKHTKFPEKKDVSS